VDAWRAFYSAARPGRGLRGIWRSLARIEALTAVTGDSILHGVFSPGKEERMGYVYGECAGMVFETESRNGTRPCAGLSQLVPIP
jgi:hypothetical protein